MTSLLRKEWICPAVLKGIGELQESLEKDSSLGRSLTSPKTFGKSKTLSTILSNKPQFAQLVHPPEGRGAIISDGFSQIRAIFAQDTVDPFTETPRIDIQGMRGGIIQINNSKLALIFQPGATASFSQLKIRISDFKLIGSVGSSTFGEPSEITGKEEILVAVASLGQRVNNESQRNIWTSATSNSRSPNSKPTDRESPLESQTAFATQAPPPAPDTPTKNPQQQPQNRVPNFSSNILLSLLTNSFGPKLPKINSIASEEAPSSSPDASKKAALAGNPAKQVLEITSRLEAKANSQHSQPSSSLPSPRKSSLQVGQPLTTPSPSEDDVPGSVNVVSKNENTKPNGKNLEQPALVSSDFQTKEQQDPPSQGAFVDQFQISNPFAGMKRIPHRYIQIPEQQESILAGQGSWFEARGDERSAYANIPANIREDLNKYISRKLDPSRSQESDDLESEDGLTGGTKAKEVDDGEEEDEDISEEVDSSPQAGAHKQHRGSSIAQDVLLRANNDDEQSSEASGESDEEQVSWPPSSPRRGLNPDQDESDLHQKLELENDPQLSPPNCTIDSAKERLQSPDASPENVDHPKIARLTQSQQSEEELKLPTSAQEHRKQNSKPQANSHAGRSFIFPPSSPGGSDELDFEVPLAVGFNAVGNYNGLDEVPERSQKFSSTISQSSPLVQVKQTPHPKINHLTNGSRRTISGSVSMNLVEHRFHHPSSSLRIPATFNDVNVAGYPSTVKEVVSSNISEARATFPVADERKYSHQMASSVNLQNLSDSAVGVEESDSLQQQRSPEKKYSLVETGILTSQTARSQVTCNQIVNLDPDKPTTPRSLHHPMAISSPPQQYSGLSSIQVPASNAEVDQKLSTPKSPVARQHGLKRRIHDTEERSKKIPTKRARGTAAIAEMIKKEEDTTKDIIEMAREFRRSFKTRFLDPEEQNRPATPSEQPSSPSAPRPFILPSSPPIHPETIPSTSSNKKSTLIHPVVNGVQQSVGDQSGSPVETSNPKRDSIIHKTTPENSPSEKTLEILKREESGPEDSSASETHCSPRPLEDGGHDIMAASSIFDEFISRYPDYRGSKKEFTWALVYIEWLDKQDRTVNDFLCDDFIRVLASNYKDYRDETREKPRSEVLTGWKWYNKNVHAPVYLQKVIYEDIFSEAISSLDPQEVQIYRSCFDSDLPHMGINSGTSTKQATPSVAPAPTPIQDQKDQETPKVAQLDETAGSLTSKQSSPGPGNTQASATPMSQRVIDYWGGNGSPELGSPTTFNRSHANNNLSNNPPPTSPFNNMDDTDKSPVPVLPKKCQPPPSKRRFFETASPTQSVVSQGANKLPDQASSSGIYYNTKESKKKRELPWPRATSSQASPAADQRNSSSFKSRRSMPLAGNTSPEAPNSFSAKLNYTSSKLTPREACNLHPVESIAKRNVQRASPVRQPPISSILGATERQRRPSLEGKKEHARASSSHRDDVNPRSTTTSKMSSHHVSTIHKQKNKDSVGGWLEELEEEVSAPKQTSLTKRSLPNPKSAPISRVASGLKRKSSWGEIVANLAKKKMAEQSRASHASTPNSSLGGSVKRGICIKPKTVNDGQEEPKTQAWDL